MLTVGRDEVEVWRLGDEGGPQSLELADHHFFENVHDEYLERYMLGIGDDTRERGGRNAKIRGYGWVDCVCESKR
jgi:hypothetical protein